MPEHDFTPNPQLDILYAGDGQWEFEVVTSATTLNLSRAMTDAGQRGFQLLRSHVLLDGMGRVTTVAILGRRVPPGEPEKPQEAREWADEYPSTYEDRSASPGPSQSVPMRERVMIRWSDYKDSRLPHENFRAFQERVYKDVLVDTDGVILVPSVARDLGLGLEDV